MRTSGLAAAWEAGHFGTAIYWGAIQLDFVSQRLEQLGITSQEARPEVTKESVLLVDSYDKSVRAAGGVDAMFKLRVLVDDVGGPIAAGYDGVWHPHPEFDSSLYPTFSGFVLSGEKFVPVRRVPHWIQKGPSIGAIFGGADLAAPLLQALTILPSRISLPCHAAGDWVAGTLWNPLPKADPWNVLARCSSLIIAAGSSVWEAAAVGIPCVVVVTASNQTRIAEWCDQAGCPVIDARNVASAEELAGELIASIAQAKKLPALVDGSANVATAISERIRNA